MASVLIAVASVVKVGVGDKLVQLSDLLGQNLVYLSNKYSGTSI